MHVIQSSLASIETKQAMHSQILNAILNDVTQHKSYDTLPEGIKLPFDCIQELTDFDEKLKENSTFKLLVCYLHNFEVGFYECIYFLLSFIHFYIFYIFLYTIFYYVLKDLGKV